MTTPAVIVEEQLEEQTGSRRARRATTRARVAPGGSPTSRSRVIVFLWVVPTIGILLTSFRSRDDQAEGRLVEPLPDPSQFADLTIQNYKDAIQGTNLGEGFVNSLAIALPATFIRSWWLPSRRTRSPS